MMVDKPGSNKAINVAKQIIIHIIQYIPDFHGIKKNHSNKKQHHAKFNH